MGMFITVTYAEGTWTAVDEPEDALVPDEGPFLVSTVHDSDIASVAYRPGPDAGRGDGVGVAYLGVQPRDYFEDETASEDVDLDEQAEGLARWAALVSGRVVAPEAVRPLLAEADIDMDVEGDEDDDVFVEETLARLVRLLGLPVPPDLADLDEPEDVAV